MHQPNLLSQGRKPRLLTSNAFSIGHPSALVRLREENNRMKRSNLIQPVLVLVTTLLMAATGVAQNYSGPPSFFPGQLDNLVSRIALYPDPLLAQIFAAASFPEEIPDAAQWANEYRNLNGNELADAIYQANLQFDPAVQALIPFPKVLNIMARDPNWTSELGNAVLADRSAVMDAVQRRRRLAEEYGYLRSNQQVRVVSNYNAIEIEPMNPSYVYVPVYDPYIVYAPPRPGYFIGGALSFEPCYSIGAFGGWGWGGGFNWSNHSVFVNHSAWGRTWYNRDAYVHNYGNWNRGTWRGTYESRNERFRTEGTRYGRSDSAGYYRGGEANRSIPRQSYDRGNGNPYRTGNGNAQGTYRGGQTSPITPSQTYDRGNGNQYRTGNGNAQGTYRGGQTSPITPSQTYDRGNGNQYRTGNGNAQGTYRGGQSSPITPSQTYDRGNGSQYRSGNGSPQGTYRGGQTSPITPSQTYDRGNASGNGSQGTRYGGERQVPAVQNRGFERNMQGNNPNRSYDRPAMRDFSRSNQPAPVVQGPSYQPTARQNSGAQSGRQGPQGGEGGRNSDRPGRRIN